MEVIVENILAYLVVGLFVGIIFFIYIRKGKKKSSDTATKIEKAKELGIYEPVSLHPVVNHEICIGSGACIEACPEKDILGIVNGQAHTVNASRCVGHGACFHACPVEAITLHMGTEKRGVELPHVSPEFETNIPGLFIAGELGGMGLIKNAVEQGKQAVEYAKRRISKKPKAKYDIIIVGAGPAGISGTLTAAEKGLKFLTLEQESLGGTIFSFPRKKVVMTSTMNLPLYGKLKLKETSKPELLDLWTEVLEKNNITINEQEKVESIEQSDNQFTVKTSRDTYTTQTILLAIGRRGSPRKLGVPGEGKEKVSYKLIEPELIKDEKVLVVGGGDSAIESALMLEDEGNEVTISYRKEKFSRLKPKNHERIEKAIEEKRISVIFNSNVKEIKDESIILTLEDGSETEIENDLVYIFAGGVLPTKFLEEIGIKITKKFGDAVLKHEK